MDSATVTVNAPALNVTKTNSPTIIGQNGIVTSTIVVTNNGNATLSSISIDDDLPSGTTYVASGSSANCSPSGQDVVCTSNSNLGVGSSVTFIVRFNVNSTSGIQTNYVTAYGYIGGDHRRHRNRRGVRDCCLGC